MNKLLRFATVTLASAALVAGGTTAATAAPGDGVAVTRIKLKSTATYYKTSNTVVGNISASAPAGTQAYGFKATVRVNGRPVAYKVAIYLGRSGGFYYNRSWGAGLVSLTNITASGSDASGSFTNKAIPTPSNAVRIRYAVESSSGIKVTKRGKKLKFKVTATYRDKAGKKKSAKRATIQVKKNGKWKTLKKVKLNSKGKATYKRSDKKKRTYRMVVKTTNTLQGGTTRGGLKI